MTFIYPAICQIVKDAKATLCLGGRLTQQWYVTFLAPLTLIESILAQGLQLSQYANSFQPPVQQLAGNVILVMSKLKAVYIAKIDVLCLKLNVQIV